MENITPAHRPAPRVGAIPVNNHSWLTHEHGDRAIAARACDRLRELARQARLVGANGLASHWDTMSDIFDESHRGS